MKIKTKNLSQGARHYVNVSVDSGSIDLVNRTVTAVASSLKPDRERFSVLPSALMKHLERFFANPVFLWDHRRGGSKGGEPEDVLGTVIDVRESGDDLIVTFKYAEERDNPKAEAVWKQVVAGNIRAYSVSFLVHDYEVSPQKSLPSKVNKYFEDDLIDICVTDAELLEISQVIIPMHHEAVRRSLSALKDKILKPKNKSEEVAKMTPEELLKALAKALDANVEIKALEPEKPQVVSASLLDAKAKSLKEEVMAEVNTKMESFRSEVTEGIDAILAIVAPKDPEDESEAPEAEAEA